MTRAVTPIGAIGAGYCETSWAPLMTVETAIHTDIVFDEVWDETEIHDASVGDVDSDLQLDHDSHNDRFDGHPMETDQPSTPGVKDVNGDANMFQSGVDRRLNDQIEHAFSQALMQPADEPAAAQSPGGDVQAVRYQTIEEHRKSLSQLIQSSSMPVRPAAHDRDSVGCAPEVSMNQAAHVETILEFLHSDPADMQHGSR